MARGWHACTAMVLLAAALSGCAQSRFTRERYETIYRGQPAANVRQTLGKPTVAYEDRWQYVHVSPYYKAVIHFEDGRVSRKEWTYGRQEQPEPPAVEDAQAN